MGETIIWGLAGAIAVGFVAYRVLFHGGFSGVERDGNWQGKLGRLEAERDAALQQVGELKGELAETRSTLQQRESDLAHKEAALKGNEARLADLQKAEERLGQHFETLAGKIFSDNSDRFAKQNRASLEQTLTPLRDQLQSFRTRVDQIHTEETKTQTNLLGKVEELTQLNQRVSNEADKLTQALKGSAKVRGDWGETLLERVLETSGLRRDEEYRWQGQYKDKTGATLRPDVVILLPEERCIVIDAKVSLLAYEDYANAEDEEERQVAFGKHLAATRAHIDSLAGKYDHLEGLHTPDFVLMFIPIEPAYMEVLQKDYALYGKALEKSVALVGPTTLMATLRLVENIWRTERQSRNAQQIAERAGSLYDKFTGFVEDLQDIGKRLGQVDKAYTSALGKLSDGRGNLVRQAEQLRELGASTSKRLPKELLGGDGDADENARELPGDTDQASPKT